ncbi:MAG: hypothetical protein Q7S74_03040 [Nanoarchaeota archaeon]|nr:hypothetical protein [Nanoarchaeota archaeon]
MAWTKPNLEMAPLIGIFRIRRNFDRTIPFFWVFLFSLLFMIVGLSIKLIRIFAWVGGFVFLICGNHFYVDVSKSPLVLLFGTFECMKIPLDFGIFCTENCNS